jgi:7-cyano-7-deazaguanine synthase
MKSVVLISGGVDSATALAIAAKESQEVITLHIDYGQPTQEKERWCARKLAEHFGVREHIELDVSPIFAHIKGGLTDPDAPLHTRHVDEGGRATSYVPQRNLILLAIAGGIAEARGFADLWYSPNANDAAYPDCLKPFADSLEETLTLGSGKLEFHVHRPLIDMQKWEIVELGEELGVPWELTWSCYTNEDAPCGKCASCKEREEGFEKAGVEDPVHVV